MSPYLKNKQHKNVDLKEGDNEIVSALSPSVLTDGRYYVADGNHYVTDGKHL